MTSDEGHIHWDGTADSTVTYLDQELQLTSEVTNLDTPKTDPIGTIRIRLNGHVGQGLALDSSEWEPIPGTSPVLEAVLDDYCMVGHIRIRLAVPTDDVSVVGDLNVGGDLTMPDGLIHMLKTIATDIGSPLFNLLFTTNAAAIDPNLLEIAINNDPMQIVTWLNESGRYRAEQRAPLGFDHLITLVASFASASGHLLQFERRDGANARIQMGAVNQDGRLMTSLYPFTAITNIDPNVTGKYSAQVASLVELPGVRRNFDDEVRIRGRIAVTAAGPVAGDVIMVLPAGFAPTNQQWLSVTTTTGIAVPCEIMTSGNVVSRRTQAGATNLVFENFIYKTS